MIVCVNKTTFIWNFYLNFFYWLYWVKALIVLVFLSTCQSQVWLWSAFWPIISYPLVFKPRLAVWTKVCFQFCTHACLLLLLSLVRSQQAGGTGVVQHEALQDSHCDQNAVLNISCKCKWASNRTPFGIFLESTAGNLDLQITVHACSLFSGSTEMFVCHKTFFPHDRLSWYPLPGCYGNTVHTQTVLSGKSFSGNDSSGT